MTSNGHAPIAGVLCLPKAKPIARHLLCAVSAAVLLSLATAGTASAAGWSLDFEADSSGSALANGKKVGSSWSTGIRDVNGDNTGINLTISTYDRSSTGKPSGGLPAAGAASVASGGRQAVVFNTNRNSTSTNYTDVNENDLRIRNSSGSLQGFRYYSQSGDGDSDSMPADIQAHSGSSSTLPVGKKYTSSGNTYYNPGNVLILDDSSSSNGHGGSCPTGTCSVPDNHNDGGLFVFAFSAPVSLTSIDFFDVEYDASDQNGQHDFQQISFFNAAGQEIFVTPGSVNIASALDSDNSEGNGTQQLYVPYTGDKKWRRLTFNIENVAWMTIGCKYECAIDNIKGQKTKGPGGGTVPEPGVLALLGMGMAGLVAVRRRRA